MTQRELLDEFAALPLQAQREVVDFIAFLRQEYRQTAPIAGTKAELAGEEFIGMWSDREDLAESNRWVRNVREEEWFRSDG